MQDKPEKYRLLYITIILIFITGYLFYLDLQRAEGQFKLAVLDIGQGDAIFIESPTGVQVLVDSGPQGRISSVLNQVMNPFDRSIDAIIITNPDADHIAGFLDVLKNYKIGVVLEPGTYNPSKTYKNLEQVIREKNIPNILARKGMRLDLGGGAQMDIIFPDRDVSTWEANDGSIVARLSYGDTSVMLTGDATINTEKLILQNNTPVDLDVDILKVGHHGSRTSTSSDFVQALSPTYALISDGKGNSYGHPHKETLDTLNNLGVKILRTDLLGTIIFESDGKNILFK